MVYNSADSNSVLLTLVTVCYNPGNLLHETYNQIVNNLMPSVEYIVIDGGSDDGTVSWIREQPVQPTFLISEKDRGISHAFNKGIALASGTYVALLNAGDLFAIPLKAIVHYLTQQTADVVYANLAIKDEKKRVRAIWKANHEQLDRDMTLCHPATIIRKSAYEKWGAYSEEYRYAMDYELLLRFKINGAVFKQVNEVWAVMVAGGKSDHGWQLALREVFRARAKHLPGVKERSLKNEFKIIRRQLSRYINIEQLKFILFNRTWK